MAFVYSVSQSLKRIYYDGAPFATATNSVDALTTSRAGARIGWPCDGTYCNGKIDEMRFYARALSPAEIALLAAETYTLTVNSGTGDGAHPEGTAVPIVADSHPTGEFLEWVGDTDYVTDPGAASTSVTMPAGDVEVTATYIGPYWRGDLNEDESVGQTDLDIVLDQWGNSGVEISDPRADPNDDDSVGQTDLDIVLDDWGNTGRQPL